MKLFSPLLTIWLAGVLPTSVFPPPADAAPPQDSEPATDQTVTYEEQVLPFVKRYCTGCHGKREPKAEINLLAYTDALSVVRNRKVWEKVLEVLVHRQMPPPEKTRQPTEAEREAIGRWIHAELANFDCGEDVDPGRVTMRRLNRTEYNQTIHDLLGVDFRPADDFPADDVGYGFDNIGDVLSMPPLLVEKYMEAAEKVVGEAVASELRSRYAPRRYQAETLRTTESASADVVGNSLLSINREGEAYVDHEFRESGKYVLLARAFAQQAGPEFARMGFRLDDRKVKDVEVAAEAGAPEVYSATVDVEAGTRRLAVAYLNNFNSDGDRNLLVDWLEVRLAVEDEDGSGSPRLFTCWPTDEKGETCAREILAAFVPRAYRRPVGDDELDRLIALFNASVVAKDPFPAAISVALTAVLSSPYFLFKVEAPAVGSADESVALGDYELASRLSYFLWSSMPDAELFALAEAGELGKPEVLEAQTLRMLRDPRSQRFVESFAGQWLQTRRLPGLSPDPTLFPNVDADLLRAMERETLLFFETVLRDDRSILEFIDSDFTVVNGRLARHYGIEGVSGEEFQRVSLKDTGRGGVLTQASILTLTSNPTRTSPVKRGLWILEQILDDPPPPPPPNVEQLNEAPEAILSGSLRQRMEKHRTNPSCAVCHEKMDAIGFAFENFDAVGAWRDFDGQFEIDPSGTLPGGQPFQGAADLKRILLEDAEKFAHALAAKTLTYALGRGLEYYDKCAVDEIVASLVENEYRFSQLILGVVNAEPFRRRRGGAAEP